MSWRTDAVTRMRSNLWSFIRIAYPIVVHDEIITQETPVGDNEEIEANGWSKATLDKELRDSYGGDHIKYARRHADLAAGNNEPIRRGKAIRYVLDCYVQTLANKREPDCIACRSGLSIGTKDPDGARVHTC